jgi:hypothetical protein
VKPSKRKSLIAREVRTWLPRLLVSGLLAFSLVGWSADQPHAVPDLTVHEWGTFTAICRHRWSSDRMVAVGPAAIPGVYGSAQIR